MKMDDSKALSQFILKAVAGEDIVLKSRGEQYFSYLYVADAVGGILKCPVAGECGGAYNLGNIESDIRLKDLAEMVAEIAGVKVVYDLPDEKERVNSQNVCIDTSVLPERKIRMNLIFGPF